MEARAHTTHLTAGVDANTTKWQWAVKLRTESVVSMEPISYSTVQSEPSCFEPLPMQPPTELDHDTFVGSAYEPADEHRDHHNYQLD